MKIFSVRLPEELIQALKHLAVDKEQSLQEIVTEVLTDYVNAQKEGAA